MNRHRIRNLVSVVLLVSMLGACASTTSGTHSDTTPGRSASDPWEPVNRGVYKFNRGLDKVTLRPIARGYRKVMPVFIRRGAGNFFSNLHMPLTIVNQLLQGKGRQAMSDTGRLLLNSTVGIGGLFDPASAAGLEHHREDFGQTLAVWGVPDGPFVMVPLLGPRNLRDAAMIPLNFLAHPLHHYDNSSARDRLWGLEAVNVRARLLAGESLIEDSVDPYIVVRDAYQQNRRFLINDGESPDDYDELFDEIDNQVTSSTH